MNSDEEFKSRIFFSVEGGGMEGKKGMPIKLWTLSIERITQNPKLGFFVLIFPFFWGGGGGGGGAGWRGRAGQGARGGICMGVRAIILYVTHCIKLIHISLNFHQNIP